MSGNTSGGTLVCAPQGSGSTDAGAVLIAQDDNFPAAGLTVGQLKELVTAAVVAAQAEALRKGCSGVERVSAGKAAAIAKKARAKVLAACASGALPAQRDGTRWSIRMADLDAWCSARFPEGKPPAPPNAWAEVR